MGSFYTSQCIQGIIQYNAFVFFGFLSHFYFFSFLKVGHIYCFVSYFIRYFDWVKHPLLSQGYPQGFQQTRISCKNTLIYCAGDVCKIIRVFRRKLLKFTSDLFVDMNTCVNRNFPFRKWGFPRMFSTKTCLRLNSFHTKRIPMS